MCLSDPEGSIEKRNHWEKTSHSLLVGAILHILYAGQDRTLCGVANFLSDPAHPFDHTLRLMMTTAHLGRQGVHPVVASSAREVLNKSENERSGVLSTAMSFLGPLSRSDYRGRDLPLRLAHRRPDLGRAPGLALPRGPAVRHQPHQAADSTDPEPDRPVPD